MKLPDFLYRPMPRANDEQKAKAQKAKTILSLFGLTALFYGILKATEEHEFSLFIFFGYVFVSVVLIISYVIYNRGFSRKNVTADMLPDDWSPEQKKEFVEDGARRLKKSKWMLILIIPFVLTFAIYFVDLFFFDTVKEMFSLK